MIVGVETGLVSPAPATERRCAILPVLRTTNVTLPAFAEVAERAMWYSRSVTLIVVDAVEPWLTAAATAAPARASDAASPAARNGIRLLVMPLLRRRSPIGFRAGS